MKSHVFINEHSIVECKVTGDQTIDTITKMGQEITRFLDELGHDRRPLLILDDIINIGKVPSEGRKAVVSFAKTLKYDRLAMLGTNNLLRVGANLIARAAGKSKKIQYFTNRQKAVEWLKHPQ